MGTARKGPDEATEVDPVDDGGEAGRFDGRPLAILRRARRLTQKELAVAAGLSERNVSRIETGKVELSRAHRRDFARVLGLPEYVFEDAADFLRYVDEEAGEGGRWASGRWSGAPEASAPAGEIKDDPVRLRRLERFEENARIAEAGGRWVKALILRVLQQQPPDDSYDGY